MKRKLTLLMAMCIHVAILQAQWALTGNSIASTDFLGSTNAQPLIFKANNVKAGLIDYDNTKLNTAFGYQALLSNTGTVNSAFGYNALTANTSGTYSEAFGVNALQRNTTGSANSAFGSNSLGFNTSGDHNVAFGQSALFANTTGQFNTSVGALSLASSTTGNNNSIFGLQAAFNNITGNSNVVVGMRALYTNTAGSNLVAIGDSALYNQNGGTGKNTAIGSKTLYTNTTGYTNTALGFESLYTNSTGGENTAMGYHTLYLNTTGELNTAAGREALAANTTGNINTAYGWSSLLRNTTGYYNTAIGGDAIQYNTTGHENTAVGEYSLVTNTTGSAISVLGVFSDVNANNYTNTTVIGYNALGTASNQVRVGNSSVTSIGGYQPWTNISDGRVKKNIKADVPGLAFINKLIPVTYNFNLEAADKILQAPQKKDKEGRVISRSADEIIAEKQTEEVLHTGFVAQDVEKAATSLHYDFSGVDKPKNEKDLYGLRYSEFVVPLVKAVQELSIANDSLKSLVDDLQTQINDIKQQIRNLKTGDIPAISSDAAFLKQNAPNPFYSNTTISYYIPLNSNHAQIVITDISGRNLQNIAVNNKGFGQVTISAGTLASGSYIYSLIIDGKKSDSKQMILTK